MAKIPQILQSHINTAFPANVCLVGSVLPNGFAQVTPRGGTMVFDDEHIGLWERGKGSTTETLVDGKKITIYFRKSQLRADGILPKGGIARFYGTARIYRSGPIYEQVWTRLIQPEKDRDPDKKGFDVLLLACSILLRRGVDFRCVVVGDGAERKRLLAMRQSLQLENHVEMPGKLSFGQVKSWLYRAAVFAMPSVVTPEGETDGLPTVVIEAMASSLPIVGTWTAGIPEAVHEQVNGFLVPPNAPELFADRVQFLLATPDLRARFGTEGRRLAEMHFDLKRKASIISELIRQYVGFSPHSSPVSLPQSEHVLQSQEPQ